MIKIGFIDNFLSEWHANNYPDMIRANERARSLGMDVCYAYAKEEVSPYDGVTTDEWCRAHGVRRVGSVEELSGQIRLALRCSRPTIPNCTSRFPNTL